MNKLLTLLLLAASTSVMAELPPPSPEAKAKAAETAAKQAWAAKVDGYQLCESQNKVATTYRTSALAAGKPLAPPIATPPCSDPGPFKYVAAQEAKPLEAAGAHSPSTPAASPPNNREADASTKAPGDSKEPTRSNGPATVTEPAKANSPEPSKK